MKADEIRRAKLEAELARQRLSGTLTQLQQKLKPTNIATNAWEGVKERGADIADDAVQAVKTRPYAVSAALGAFTLFLARQPIRSALARLFSRGGEEDLVTTDLSGADANYDLTAPSGALAHSEGVNA